YVVGHRIPSIAESRENFRLSARKVYEIRGGVLGTLYRDGGIVADSRDYLMNVDAVGNDFRLYPIPNCGKGQPMQTKRLGNGGPTMRSRARVAGARESRHARSSSSRWPAPHSSPRRRPARRRRAP